MPGDWNYDPDPIGDIERAKNIIKKSRGLQDTITPDKIRSKIMVTKEQYQDAVKQVNEFEKTINQWHKEQRGEFAKRMKNGPVFTDAELRYSACNLCPCGHGLAYPKDCGGDHYWDCSAILKGIEDKNSKHCAQVPFSMTNIKSESEYRGTTRGVFKPQNKE